MPIAGPETALAATIVTLVESFFVRFEIVRPGASQRGFTNFQSLTPRLNDLHEPSMTYADGPQRTHKAFTTEGTEDTGDTGDF